MSSALIKKKLSKDRIHQMYSQSTKLILGLGLIAIVLASCAKESGPQSEKVYITLDSQQSSVSRFYAEKDKYLILTFYPGFIGAYSTVTGALSSSYKIEYETFLKIGRDVIKKYPSNKLSIINEKDYENYLQFQFVTKTEDSYHLAWLYKTIENYKEDKQEVFFFVISTLNEDLVPISHRLIQPPKQRFIATTDWDQFDWSWGSTIIQNTGFFLRDINGLKSGQELYSQYHINTDTILFDRFSKLHIGANQMNLLFQDLTEKKHSSDYGLNLFSHKDAIYAYSNNRIVDFESLDVVYHIQNNAFDFALVDKIKSNTENDICLCGYVFEDSKTGIGSIRIGDLGTIVNSQISFQDSNSVQLSCDIVDNSIVIINKSISGEYYVLSSEI